MYWVTQFRNEVRQLIGGRPRTVLGIMVLHGVILQQTVLPGLLTVLAYLFVPAVFYCAPELLPIRPQLGVVSLAWAICFAGLWYSQLWAWLSALVLGGLAVMAVLCSAKTSPGDRTA